MTAVTSLAALGNVTLEPKDLALLAMLDRRSGGPPHWRLRKRVEATDLLRLAAVSSVARCLELDLDDELRAVMHLEVPVAVGTEERVEIHLGVVVALRYPAMSLVPGCGVQPQVAVLRPTGVFHPNVVPMPPQVLCLGALPPGVRVVELCWMTWRALAMQDRQVDELDPAGVLHAGAARYWQTRIGCLPLTRRSLFARAEEAS
ncbi:MAG TPA: hypothetical protein VF384_18540 [Planctomycetota bacterium]